MIAEGVFAKFPDVEGGGDRVRCDLVERLHLARPTRRGKGVRAEVPWVTRPPSEIVRDHVRFTMQPIDAADEAEAIVRLVDHLKWTDCCCSRPTIRIGSLTADEALPSGIPDELFRKILSENALATYPRLSKADHAMEITL